MTVAKETRKKTPWVQYKTDPDNITSEDIKKLHRRIKSSQITASAAARIQYIDPAALSRLREKNHKIDLYLKRAKDVAVRSLMNRMDDEDISNAHQKALSEKLTALDERFKDKDSLVDLSINLHGLPNHGGSRQVDEGDPVINLDSGGSRQLPEGEG